MTRWTRCRPPGGSATRSSSGTPTTTCAGADAVIVPGGFSYGDYLRVGAIARFAPVMEEVERFARAGGPVLGICNGFQVLCEAGLLPGALLPNTSLRFLCRQVGLTVASAATAWTRACTPGERALDPRQAHDRPLLGARPGARRARGRRPGRVPLRARARTPTARRATSRASPTHAGNVVGLMPHPEHAVDPLTGSVDGLAAVPLRRRRGGRAGGMTVATRHRELGLTDSRVRAHRRAHGARAQRGRARGLLADVVRALRLQALQASCCARCRPRARAS